MKRASRVRPLALLLLVPTVSLLGLSACTDSPSEDEPDRGVAGAGGAAGAAGGGGGGGQAGAGGSPGASCMDDTGCPPGARCDTASGECRPACVNDAACGARARCTPEGFCVDLPACDDDGQCGAGQTCTCDGVCEPVAGDPCATDLQCDVADYCDACSGTCKTRAGQCEPCRDDAGCDPRASCYPVGAAGLGHCLQRCQGNCDRFGPGYECLEVPSGDSLCVPSSRECAAVTECEGDGDCPIGRFCNDRQACQPGCMDDVGCPNGQICNGGRCAPPCAGDGDCEGEAVCQPDGRCRVPGGCTTSADCPEPVTYCDRDTQMCVPGCQVDDDCQDASLACTGGDCVPRGCVGAFQCGFGEVCDLESNQCVLAEGRHCEPDCDPMDMNACGGEGRRCISLQDMDMNPLGDYCFEPCAEPPNACPQGYQCVELMDDMGNPQAELCIRRCDLDPFR